MSQLPFALYNPALLPPDVLLDEFTARRPLLDTLLGIVRGNAPGHPLQHCLLIGARGMGKTTTLWAVAHRVARDPDLARQWQPVVFDEESRRVGDLADFWLEAIRQWEFATKDNSDRAGDLLKHASADIEERARQTFVEMVARSGKRALLLIDNLNDLFSSIRDQEPLHRLRAFLMKESSVMLIGGATSYFEAITSVDQPFYDFFRYFELKPLTLEEMRDCLMNLAKTHGDKEVEESLDQRGGTIQALHLFTGGNPRLVKTFYRLLRDGLHTDIRADLEKLLDEFTPYFKAIVDALPMQQQRIFDAVALAWDPVEVSKLAIATRLPSNQISAQLRALGKAGLIREANGHPKRKSYLLSDRFSNIHYLMRHGRAARNRLDWFVATVRILFPDREAAEVLARLAHDSAECGLLGFQDASDVLHSALNRAESAESRRHLLHTTIGESWDSKAWETLDQWFCTERAIQELPEMEIIAFCQQMPDELRKELGYQPEDASWWHQLTDFLEDKKAWNLAKQAYLKTIEIAPSESAPWTNLGNLLKDHLQNPIEAEKSFKKAIELDPEDPLSWNNFGVLLTDLKRLEEAEICLDRAIAINSTESYFWNNLGVLLSKQPKRFEDAENAYQKSIDLDPNDSASWTNLGSLLKYRGKSDDSEIAFRKAIELDPDNSRLWNNLGNLLKNTVSRRDEAEEAYRKAIKIDSKYAFPWNGLGNILREDSNRQDEAEVAYRNAINLDPYRGKSWAGLSAVLSLKSDHNTEARYCATRAILIEPEYGFARQIFLRLCANHSDDWFAVLPTLVEWCIENPNEMKAFDFTVQGFLLYAQLTSPKHALAILEDISDLAPFETLQDALIASTNRDHLHRLAPERQAVAIEMMKRLTAEPS